jgi:hypothetical protein
VEDLDYPEDAKVPYSLVVRIRERDTDFDGEKFKVKSISDLEVLSGNGCEEWADLLDELRKMNLAPPHCH